MIATGTAERTARALLAVLALLAACTRNPVSGRPELTIRFLEVSIGIVVGLLVTAVWRERVTQAG
jgi:hypothetical protein